MDQLAVMCLPFQTLLLPSWKLVDKLWNFKTFNMALSCFTEPNSDIGKFTVWSQQQITISNLISGTALYVQGTFSITSKKNSWFPREEIIPTLFES